MKLLPVYQLSYFILFRLNRPNGLNGLNRPIYWVDHLFIYLWAMPIDLTVFIRKVNSENIDNLRQRAL